MMEIQSWWIWIFFAVLFIVAEIFTAGFFIFWFGIAAAVVGILALFGVSSVWQWIAFIVLSAVLTIISRRFADKFTSKQPDGIGADRFLGRTGIVIEKIDNDKNTGRIRLDQEEWRAESVNDELIEVGTKVKILKVEGVHLVVEKIS
ncbi:NfeD family protein [candidate division KSB1 bacterium]|nr:NfeD family protein [candidate division KSB1 bacterium]